MECEVATVEGVVIFHQLESPDKDGDAPTSKLGQPCLKGHSDFEHTSAAITAAKAPPWLDAGCG